MRPLRYRPYEDVTDTPNVVVDGSANPATVLVLSHWPGMPSPEGLVDDLSAQMAFRYLDRDGGLHGDAEVVTNNHFDQDGLAGVYALACPEDALGRRELLVDLAAAGDFATYRHRAAARLSMVISAFTDPARSPLGADALTGDYADQCAVLYEETLGRLPELVDDVSAEGPAWRHLWADEDAELSASEAAIAAGDVTIAEMPDLDLAVVQVPEAAPAGGGHRFGGRHAEGLHPMALNNATSCFRVAQLRGRRYEVAYRYETWVQYRSRRPLPRVDLAPLAAELTEAEPDGVAWRFDGVGDLTPRLAMVDSGAESGLAPDDFLGRLRHHLAEGQPAWDPYDPASSRRG